MAMPLRVLRSEGSKEVRLVGEVDISTVTALAEALRDDVERGGDLVLDLAGLAFMDSSGIQLLIKTSKALDGRGRLKLIAPGELVRRTLELVSVDRLENVEIIDDQHT
jgi:anti-anti-sigma factor